jgi:hypothetical protein
LGDKIEGGDADERKNMVVGSGGGEVLEEEQ